MSGSGGVVRRGGTRAAVPRARLNDARDGGEEDRQPGHDGHAPHDDRGGYEEDRGGDLETVVCEFHVCPIVAPRAHLEPVERDLDEGAACGTLSGARMRAPAVWRMRQTEDMPHAACLGAAHVRPRPGRMRPGNSIRERGI